MEYLSVDRINGSFAVCEREDMTTVELSLSLLPEGTKEGSVLCFDGDSYKISEEKEAERKENILKLQALLFGEE